MKTQRRSEVAPKSLKRQNGAVSKCMAYGGDGLWQIMSLASVSVYSPVNWL